MSTENFQRATAKDKRRLSARWLANRFPQHRAPRTTTTMTTTVPRPLSVTSDTFEKEVLGASFERPVVVDFSASWCPPCQLASTTLRAVAAARFETSVVATVDIDAEPQLARRYDIQALPTLLFFHNGEVVGSLVGLHGFDQILRQLDTRPPALLSA